MSNYTDKNKSDKVEFGLEDYLIQTFTDSDPKPSPDPLACIFPYNQSEIDRLGKKGAGVFKTINPQENHKKRGIDNTSYWATVGLDLDVAKEQERLDKKEIARRKKGILKALNNIDLPATHIIETKNGIQPQWIFDSPISLPDIKKRRVANEQYKQVVKGLGEDLGYESEGDSISRVLRLEGTLHQKDPKGHFKIEVIGGSGKPVDRKQFLKKYLLSQKEKNAKKYKEVASDKESIYNIDIVTGLQKISGHKLVNSEKYEFENERNGKRQIIINGRRSGQWIDVKNNAIGGHPGGKGSYNLVRWVKWYNSNLSEEEIREELDVLILDKKPQSKSIDVKGYKVTAKDIFHITIKKDELTYQLKKVKGKYEIALYVNSKLAHQDVLNLSSSRSRIIYSKTASKNTSVSDKEIAKDLLSLIECLSELNRNILKPENTPLEEEISKTELEKANKLLLSPTLLHDTLDTIQRLGVAGEETNALLHYLVLTSRVTDEPLSVVVKGESSVGKSYVVSKVMQLFPKNAYLDITDATAQSFFYAPENHFAHKIIVIFELHGTSKSDYSIRSLQSEKKLKIQVTVKDPKTGEFVAKEKEVNGPTGFITTTTNAKIHQENETRHLSLFPDESIDQTLRTFQKTDAKYRGIQSTGNNSIKKWQVVQKVLKPLPVLIPYAEELRRSFPKEPVRVRRDYGKMLSLIAVITILHQKQRKTKTKKDKKYLIATLVDFHIAKTLLEGVFKKTIYAIPPKTETLIEKSKEILEDNSNLKGVSISRLATELEWDYDTAKKWFDPAFQKGYFERTRKHKGSQAALYKPRNKQLPSENILPTTESLYEINKKWLGKSDIYDPISGELFKLEEDK